MVCGWHLLPWVKPLVCWQPCVTPTPTLRWSSSSRCREHVGPDGEYIRSQRRISFITLLNFILHGRLCALQELLLHGRLLQRLTYFWLWSSVSVRGDILLFCLSVCLPVRLSSRLLVSGKIWNLCLVLASQMKSTRFYKCVYPPQSPQKAFLLKA